MKKRLYVDAMPLVDEKLSGIGHAILETIRALEELPGFAEDYDLILLVPFTKRGSMSRWKFTEARERVYPFPGRILAKAEAFHLLPPLDLVFGRGTYLFMNFKNWPLSSLSRSITYVHDIAFALHPEYVQPKNQQYLEKNVPRWMRRSNTVVTVSKSSAEELKQYMPRYADKIKVVYNGVDTSDFYSRPEKEVAEARQRYGIAGPYLCYLSTIEPRKNLDVLISALENLQHKKVGVSLLIIGGFKGWLNEGIFAHIEEARKKGCKIIIPEAYVPDEDLPPLLSGAEALVHPAFHEGFGISPVQALACGTPVIASNIPVMQEILADTCQYFDPTDADELAAKIQAVLAGAQDNDERRQKGILRAKQFSWRHAAEQLRKLLG